MNAGMPYLAIATNAEIAPEAQGALLRDASKAVASGTAKPEQYVLVKLQAGQALLFAGSGEPAAFLEVKSIGYPSIGVKEMARSLCAVVNRHLGVPGNRTYIVFEDIKGAMWAYDGETFG
jgi:phenylpyruvate tautomerase